jgi:cardiolipin synthase
MNLTFEDLVAATPLILVVVLTVLQVAVIFRAILRPHRDPASRIAWVAVIGVLPLVGMIAYLLFGETNIGRKRIARRQQIRDTLPECPAGGGEVPQAYRHLAHLAASIDSFTPVSGNQAQLLADSNAMIDSLVADIDAAEDHVHLLFYIWLTDNNGGKVLAALELAVARGVTCRVIVDGLGSRALVNSKQWKSLRQAGVRVAVALAIGSPLLRLLRVFRGRIDLRNHRKIVVIDDHLTYCGSQNCADPEFRIKARYAPWVDAVMRFDGPVARQNQILFAVDWMQYTGEDLTELLSRPLRATVEPDRGIPAQVIGTGPTARHSAMPEVVVALLLTARSEVIITTPYYVPDESMQNALCATALSGVATTLIVPARNDSRIVAGASRSYYEELLHAGVQIYEFQPGLLHAKTLTMDGQVALIGSANLDRRSFELNYENNVLVFDAPATAQIVQRQREYLSESCRVDELVVGDWKARQRLWNNTLAMLGPLL